jgi:hypothetical protein
MLVANSAILYYYKCQGYINMHVYIKERIEL